MIKTETKIVKDYGDKCEMQTIIEYEGTSDNLVEEIKMIFENEDLRPYVTRAVDELTRGCNNGQILR